MAATTQQPDKKKKKSIFSLINKYEFIAGPKEQTTRPTKSSNCFNRGQVQNLFSVTEKKKIKR